MNNALKTVSYILKVFCFRLFFQKSSCFHTFMNMNSRKKKFSEYSFKTNIWIIETILRKVWTKQQFFIVKNSFIGNHAFAWIKQNLHLYKDYSAILMIIILNENWKISFENLVLVLINTKNWNLYPIKMNYSWIEIWSHSLYELWTKKKIEWA